MDSGKGPVTPEVIAASSHRLKEAVSDLRMRQTRAQAVKRLANWAQSWFHPDSPDRELAEKIRGPFPYSMVRDNLDALLLSINEDTIQALITEEGVGDVPGYPLIGHVIAANTPLLAWSSVVRALIMQSASLVKLSSQGDGFWTELFYSSLCRSCPELAECIEFVTWPSSDDVLNSSLCDSVDLLIVYGSDVAIESLQNLTAEKTPILGYGHRVSIGVVDGAASEKDTEGFARDILTYDQGGCLSPQMIFILGTAGQAQEFSLSLAKKLLSVCQSISVPERSLTDLYAIRTQKVLARMAGCEIFEDSGSRWTVVNAARSSIYPPGGYGTVHLRRIEKLADILQYTKLYHGKFQGCAVTTMRLLSNNIYIDDGVLKHLGFSRICRPGELQTPPISWRQDNRSVLSSLGAD